MKESLNTLFSAIVRTAKERDEIPGNFENARRVTTQFGEWTEAQLAEHKADEIRIWNTKNHVIGDLIADYKAAGGKRDVDRYLLPDRT